MQAKLLALMLVVFMMGCATLFDTVVACDVSGILTCNQMLGTSTQLLSEGVLPDANTLMQTCSLLDNYTTCVDEKLTGCDSKTKLGINIVKDIVDFMCKDSYKAILDNSDCWINPVLKSDINQCTVTYKETATLVNGNISIMGATWAFRQLCEAMHDVTYCMSSAAKTRCGTEPELIMHNMMNAALNRTYKLLRGCSAPTFDRMVTTSTTIESIQPLARRGSGRSSGTRGSRRISGTRGSGTSNSSTTTYSYALFITSIVSCIVVLAA